MCKGWDEAPPRAAHRPPSSRFLTSSTALLPLGSSMLQLCRTRFVAFPTSSTRPSNLAAGSEFLPNDPPVRSLVWLPFDCVFPDTLTPLEECILPSAPSHHHRSGEPCSLRWLPSRSCAQRVLDCCIWRRSALFLKALIRGSDRTEFGSALLRATVGSLLPWVSGSPSRPSSGYRWRPHTRVIPDPACCSHQQASVRQSASPSAAAFAAVDGSLLGVFDVKERLTRHS